MVGMSKAKAENKALPKRFYQRAALDPVVGGWRVLLDGKELKTQGRNALVIAARALAEAVVAEWEAQLSHINPDAMPLTRLVNLAIDRAAHERRAYIENIVAYAETDLLCYRTPEFAAQQSALFDPVLEWAAQQGVVLHSTLDLMPIPQPAASLLALRAQLETASDAEITALAMMVPLLGSAVLGFAIWRGAITVDDALVMAHLDEQLQAERWGVDDEAEAMWAHKKNDIAAAAFFLTSK